VIGRVLLLSPSTGSQELRQLRKRMRGYHDRMWLGAALMINAIPASSRSRRLDRMVPDWALGLS
jgi:hypothetical protein